jgi:hypothetical protein
MQQSTFRKAVSSPAIQYTPHKLNFIYTPYNRLRTWLRQCATNWKFAGSIPDGVIGIFH